jgi:hypothetical protein
MSMELQVSIVVCVTTSGLKLVVVIYVIIHYNYPCFSWKCRWKGVICYPILITSIHGWYNSCFCNYYLNFCNYNNIFNHIYKEPCTTTKRGYIAIQISSQTTKKEVSENPPLRTIIPCKLLSFCETITFTPVQSQILHNSRNWYNRKTFLIITTSIHHLQFTVHRKLFATNPSPQWLNESTQKSIGFRYKI